MVCQVHNSPREGEVTGYFHLPLVGRSESEAIRVGVVFGCLCAFQMFKCGNLESPLMENDDGCACRCGF